MGADNESLPPDYASTISAPPSYEEDAQPATLTLDGTTISINGTPTYTVSRSLTSIQQESSSIHLERIDTAAPEKPDSSASPTRSNTLVFYLVHPLNAQYQKDKPAYYATSTHGGLGNIVFEIQKKTLSKPEYRVLLNEGTNASSDPLFTGKPSAILAAKSSKLGGKYSWTDSGGKTIAQEEQSKLQQQPQLKVTNVLRSEVRDTLVAAWCLRIWSEVAESREARNDGKCSAD